MKIFNFKPVYARGGRRLTVTRDSIKLPKIEALQILKLSKKLKEPKHVNKKGNVVAMVLDGWLEAEVEGKSYKLKENQAILFEAGEEHRIVRGEGLMLSVSSEVYGEGLDTVWEN